MPPCARKSTGNKREHDGYGVRKLRYQDSQEAHSPPCDPPQWLPAQRLALKRAAAPQVDEIWINVQKKQREVTAEDDRPRVVDFWTFVAIDADTKLIPTYR